MAVQKHESDFGMLEMDITKRLKNPPEGMRQS
jgi:hypothetical protein